MEFKVPIAGGRLTDEMACPPDTAPMKKPPDTAPAKKAASRPARRDRPRRRAQTDIDMPDPATLVRELNHRVKNNLQIIVSLMNLRKRMLPPERREDIRFIEEHVQSMSVAYRLVYATGSMIEVSLTELISEVISGLRQIAGLPEERIMVEAPASNAMIGLDHAIALALYLAVVMPPYLDEAAGAGGAVAVKIAIAANDLTLTVRGTWNTLLDLDFLRNRLMRAYAGQLHAEIMSAASSGIEQLRFTLDRSAAEISAP
jgi:hypothetical protein